MLLDLNSWWQGHDSFEKILWGIAILFTLLFIVQSVLSLIVGDADTASGDADDYIDADDGIGNQYFTIKNLITFFTIFGWTGVACIQNGLGRVGAIAIALVAGILAVGLMIILLQSASKLRYSGTLEIKNAINRQGEVYLTIPGSRGGTGKIHILVQGSYREMDAMTDEPDSIATGKMVKVTDVINDRILLVQSAYSA